MTTRSIVLKKVFAALPQAERGKSVRLSGDPAGENVVYCNGRNVYIRNLKNPSDADMYSGHSKRTTVARYSPSRLYIASADVSGKILIWNAVSPEHGLRAQYQALGGLVQDLDWSSDSHRIVVCGNGKDRFANLFSVDNGSCCGILEGHSKLVNTCSYRQVRPFAIVTASQDNTVAFYREPSFKLKGTQKVHNHYVQVARYSRNGEAVCSGGADGKLFKYDGKQAETSEAKEIGAPAHKADIFELCFSPDDKQVLTVSGDRTAKVFDVQSGSLVWEFVSGNDGPTDWHDMQLGCLWQQEHLVTVNTRGYLLYHSLDTSLPLRVIKGHMEPITAMAVSEDGTTIFTGNQEAIIQWDVETGSSEEVRGTRQPGDLVDMALDGDHLIYVCGNQVLKFVPRKSKTGSSTDVHSAGEILVKLDSPPKAVDALNGFVVVAGVKHVTLLENQKKEASLAVKSEARCVSVHPGAATAAVGHKDNTVRIYSLHGGVLRESRIVGMHSEVSVVAYAPCGVYIAVGADQRVSALSATDYRELSKGEMHSARVRCIAWSPDSSCFVAAGDDGTVMLWDDVNDSYKKKPSILAHAKSHVNSLAWTNTTCFVTAGQDGNIKHFTVIGFIQPCVTEATIPRHFRDECVPVQSLSCWPLHRQKHLDVVKGSHSLYYSTCVRRKEAVTLTTSHLS